MTRATDLRQSIRGRVDAEQGALLALAQEVTEIPAPNPPGDTTQISQHVMEYLRRIGLPVKVYAREPTKPNIVSTVGASDGPRVILCAHMDSFPRPETWPPEEAYRGRIENGRIHGTAVGDMRAGLAITLTLGRIFAENGIESLGGVVLMFTSDEESGGREGAELVLRQAEEVRGADACVIADQSGITAIGAAEKGFCWIRVTTAAEQGHAAYSEGRGAIAELLDAARVVFSLTSLQRSVGNGPTSTVESDVASRVTVNIGRINGGVAPNLAATSAYADVDIRIPLGMAVDDVTTELQRRLVSAGVRASIEAIRTSDPTVTPSEHAVVTSCVRHAERVTGRRAEVQVRLGASDAKSFRRNGIPAVVCGPRAHNLAGVEEFVEIHEVLEVAQVHADVVMDLLGAHDGQA